MDIQKILIAGKLSDDIKNLLDVDTNQLTFRFKKDVTTEDLQWADAYVSFKPTSNFDFYNIKWVHSFGAGVDPFLFEREWKQDVLLTRTVCSFGQRISQYCLSYYLRDLQQQDYFLVQQKNKQWQPVTPQLINDRKVLIYGTGEIGQEVAKVFTSFGMKVFGVSLSGRQKDYFRDVYSIFSENEALDEADLIINTLPLTERTDKLFGEGFFKHLTNAVFINVGRGASLVEPALLHALDNKNVRLAVLDVFQEEPLPNANALWEHEKVMITPHISAVTTVEEATNCFLETLEKIETNGELTNKVDVTKGY